MKGNSDWTDPISTLPERSEPVPDEIEGAKALLTAMACELGKHMASSARRLIPESKIGKANLSLATASLFALLISTQDAENGHIDDNTLLAQAQTICEDAGLILENGEFKYSENRGGIPLEYPQEQTPAQDSDSPDPLPYEVSIPFAFGGRQGTHLRDIPTPRVIVPNPNTVTPPPPGSPTPITPEPGSPTPEEPISRELILPSGLRIALSPDAMADWQPTNALTATYGAAVGGVDGRLVRLELPNGSSRYAEIDDLRKTPEIAEQLKQIKEAHPDIETEHPPTRLSLMSGVPLDSRATVYASSHPLGVTNQLTDNERRLLPRNIMGFMHESPNQNIPFDYPENPWTLVKPFEVRQGEPFTVCGDLTTEDDYTGFSLAARALHPSVGPTLSSKSSVLAFIPQDGFLHLYQNTELGEQVFQRLNTRFDGKLSVAIELDADRTNITAYIFGDDPNNPEVVPVDFDRPFVPSQPPTWDGSTPQTTDTLSVGVSADSDLISSTFIRDISVNFPSSPESIAAAESGIDPAQARIFEIGKPESDFTFRDIGNVHFVLPQDAPGASDYVTTPAPSSDDIMRMFSGFYYSPNNIHNIYDDPSKDTSGLNNSWTMVRLGTKFFTSGPERKMVKEHGLKITVPLEDRIIIGGRSPIFEETTGRELMDDYFLKLIDGYSSDYSLSSAGFFDQKTGEMGVSWSRMMSYDMMSEARRMYPDIDEIELSPRIFGISNLHSSTVRENIVSAVQQARYKGFKLDNVLISLDPPEGVSFQDHLFGLESIKRRLFEIGVKTGLTDVTEETFELALQFAKGENGDDAQIHMINIFDANQAHRPAFYRADRNHALTQTDTLSSTLYEYRKE